MNSFSKNISNTKHEIKICQRCENSFECKVGDVANCQCSTVSVTAAANDFLEKTDYDCLCKKCLSTITQMVEKASQSKIPTRSNQLVEGLHYYMDSGFFVFTEFYHLQKGQCCQNGCRHCAYNFQK